ncbi:hypothetical protein TRFO_42471 [Tritrichomonas foetus]|uniref:Uncharacterized protein n=1 Tax=Tritrichomonas foetus TaxID=1144522 RepID=A0A1J4KWP9_9EUKA|nr:hypothetical protein TRFO_42471 [Tritrichomonas foetus]|eukprot:OHT15594.1 hypothetical protein TRFO_42471 [Tritrichomonas foetus]
MNQFLLLANIKYLPSFCGRWELKLYFNGNNIVVLPVDPNAGFLPNSGVPTTFINRRTYDCEDDIVIDPVNQDYGDITRNFTQIGRNNTFSMVIASAMKTVEQVNQFCLGVSEMYMTLQNCKVQEIKMNVASFLLRSDIYLALKAKYTAKPWIIPANVLQYSRFSGAPHVNHFQCTLSQSVENLDTVFILFPKTPEQHTCFFNPMLTDVKMNVGDFGMVPSTSVNTFNDPRFESMVLDALNLANSPITSMNKDLARALHCWHNYVQNATNDQVDYYTDQEAEGKEWLEKGDTSNFILGISLSREGYQNGVSSPNTNVNFIFYGNRTTYDNSNYEVAITMEQLIDCALIIQVVPNSDIPIVKLTSKSVC